MPEVLHNICNMGSRDLPDMSALARGRCAPSGSCVHIRQITPAHVTYITCMRGLMVIKKCTTKEDKQLSGSLKHLVGTLSKTFRDKARWLKYHFKQF